MNNATIIATAFVLAAALALSGPSDTPAANVAPPNPVPGNDAALRAEIERLTSNLAASESNSEAVKAELAALKHSMKVAPVVSPAPVSVVAAGEVAAAGTGCADGNCAVPRKSGNPQGIRESRQWQPVRRVRQGLFGRRR